MRKIIIGISILSLILTAGVIVVEASDGDSTWKETIRAKMGEFKKMTPEERKVQKEEVMTAMTELKNSEEWQGADKKDQMKMLKESGHFPLRGFGKAMGKKIEFSEEAMTVMTELKSSEEWQNADKDEQREMLGEIMEEFGIERNLKAMHPFVKGLKKGFHKGMKWNK